MNDIVLINVSIAKYFNKKVVYERTSAGPFLLIASLGQAGFKVDFHEHFLDNRYSLSQEIERFISLTHSSFFIGIGCHSVHLPFVVMVAKALKKRFPEKKIILGGIGPSGVAKELLEKFSFIDIVAVGEAEETIVEVLRKGKESLADIKGLVYRAKDKVYVNELREPLEELDKLPLPAYSAVDFSQYEIPTIISSRGCLYRCSFCSLSLFWKGNIRYRSIDNVLKELILLKEHYGVKYVFFGDPTFNADKNRVISLCQRIKAENLNLKWECLVRADSMDEEAMRYMKDAGCEAVFYGLESGSENVYKKIKQGFGVEESIKIIKKSTEYFKAVEVGLMWGFPFETLEDFKDTLRVRDYLENQLNCEVQLRWLEPYPCTVLFRDYKNDLFLPEEISLVYDKKLAQEKISGGRDFYCEEENISSIRIVTDVTNIRLIIAASHTASFCREIIKDNPHIFCDYYRYKTPALEDKLKLARKYSIY